MIVKPDDVRKVRPIAENLSDVTRLVTYIREAETLRIIDALGAHLYTWLDTTDFSGEGIFTYTKPDGIAISITKGQYNELMFGGLYTNTCNDECISHRSEGLVTATCYFAYSRFVMNNPINSTAFGVRYKDGEFSSRVEDMVLVRNSNEAKKIGEAYLMYVVEHFKSLDFFVCCRKYTEVPRRIVKVGRKRM